MTKLIRYLSILLFALKAHALVPVEGIIMGEAVEEIQQDPLSFIFRDTYDRSQLAQNKKVKLYHNLFTSGTFLTESCGFYGPSIYATTWGDKQAKRSVAATLQYIGLDTAIKAVGAYAKKLDVGPADFKKLASNIVRNYCSKNVTVYSLRNIEQSLNHYYQNPMTEIIPSVESSPFATKEFKKRTEATDARSVEFDYAIKVFRSFCSWGGEVEDYRMMAPYVKNPYVMAFVIKNLLGLMDTFQEKQENVVAKTSEATVQVSCQDLICRKTDYNRFVIGFPLSVGSSGLNTDLAKLYCNHFRYQDYAGTTVVPQVKKWIKDAELEDPIFETNFFISLMSGVPDPLFGTEKYLDLPFVAKSSIDERWSIWATDVLSFFSRDLMFEESLKVKSAGRRDRVSIRTEGFRLTYRVTLGEMDRIVNEMDKLKLRFELKLSKNYLNSIRQKWVYLINEADYDGQKAYKKEIASYLELHLRKKERYFLQKMWNPDLARVLADDLLEQVVNYDGTLFNSYKDEMLTVPVEFQYGIFALGYLRFKADITADRLKFKF